MAKPKKRRHRYSRTTSKREKRSVRRRRRVLLSPAEQREYFRIFGRRVDKYMRPIKRKRLSVKQRYATTAKFTARYGTAAVRRRRYLLSQGFKSEKAYRNALINLAKTNEAFFAYDKARGR